MFQPTPQLRVLLAYCRKQVGLLVFGVLSFLLALSLLMTQPAQAATNNTLNFQARLQTNSGSQVADGNYNIQFNLYDVSSGGSTLWTETYLVSNTQGVRVKNGYVTVNLGSLTSFPALNWDQDLWLGLTVRGTGSCAFGACTPADSEMTPRLKITSTPYSFRAGELAKYNSGSGFTGSLRFQNTTVGNQIFELPDQGVGGTFTLLTSAAANGSYIQNTTSPQTADFNITGDGVVGDDFTVSGDILQSGAGTLATGTGAISLNGDTTLAAGKTLKLANGSNANLVTIQSGITAANYSLTLPTGLGASGDCLKDTNGSGVLGFAACSATSGVTTVGAFSGSSQTNGANITGTTITFGPADATNPGMVTTGAQTLAGAKTFTGAALFQNATNSTTAFQVQNVAGANLIGVDTTPDSNNLITNSSFETDTTGWVARGATANFQRVTTQDYIGRAALAYDSSAVDHGANYPIQLAANTGYYLNVYVKPASGGAASSLRIGYSADGSTEVTYLSANQSYNSAGWYRMTYSFTTPGSVAANAYFFITSTSSTARTFYVDAASIIPTSVGSNTLYVSEGKLQLDGVVTTPLLLRNAFDSTQAFTIQGDNGSIVFNTDTTNGSVTIGNTNSINTAKLFIASTSQTGLQVNQSSTSDSFHLVDNSGTSRDVFRVMDEGATLLQNATDSTAAFQVQNLAGANIMTVDTTGTQLVLGEASTAGGNGKILFQNSTNANTVGLQSGVTSTSYTLTLPTALGASGNCLIDSNGSGVLAFTACSNGITTVGAFAGASQANGATISGNTITFGPADATNPGMVSTGTQTFGGDKTFSGAALFRNAADSTTAFQIQDQNSANLFAVDTSGNNINMLSNNSAELSTWSTTTAMSVGASTPRVRGGSVAANGYLYHIGGVDGAGTTITTVQYAKLNADGSVGTWASTTALPDARKQFQPVVVNGYVYVIGGRNNSNTVMGTSYYAKLNADGTVGTWNTTTTLNDGSAAVRFGQGTVSYNGYVYVLGGSDAAFTVMSTVMYAKANPDGSLAAWANATALPETLTAINGGIVANGYVYVAGGYDGSVDEDDVSRAKLNNDGTLGSWTAQTGVLNPSGGGDENYQLFVGNGHLYVVGADYLDRVVSFPLNADGSVGSANALTNIGTSVVGEAAGAQYNGYFYLLGGSSGVDGGGTVRNTVYRASVPRVTIGGSLDLVAYGGENLAEGRTGGTLTAGNTIIAGTLQVQDATTFTGGVSFGGDVVLGANFAQSGSGTFSTGTGAITLNGHTTIVSGKNLSLAGGTVSITGSSTSALSIQNAGGDSVLVVDTTNKRVGLFNNLTGAQSPNYPLQIVADAVNCAYCAAVGVDVSLEAPNITAQYGQAFYNYVAPSSASTNSAYVGVNLQTQVDNANLSTGTAVTSLNVTGINMTTSTVPEMSGISLRLSNNTTGTITDGYGIRIEAAGGGTITNNYGIYQEYQTAGATDYALYFAGSGANPIFSVAGSGVVNLRNASDSTSAFAVLNNGGGAQLTVDTSNSRIILGTSGGDTTGTLLLLGNKTGSGDPTGIDGAMYYNSNAGKFRCYENGNWKDCLGLNADAGRTNPLYTVDFFDNGGTSPGRFTFSPWALGTTNATTAQGTGTAQHPGVVNLTVTTGGGAGRILSDITDLDTIALGGGESYEFVFNPTTLTNSTVYAGFHDVNGGNITDGVYFSIVGTTLRGYIENNGSQTSTSTTHTISTATWYRGRLSVNSALSAATFSLYDDTGSQLWTSTATATVPSGAGRETTNGIYWSNTGIVTVMEADYMAMWWDRSLTR